MKNEKETIGTTEIACAIAIMLIIIIVGVASMCCSTPKPKPVSDGPVDCAAFVKDVGEQFKAGAAMLVEQDSNVDDAEIMLLDYECVSQSAAVLMLSLYFKRGLECVSVIEVIPVYYDKDGNLRMLEEEAISQPVEDDPRCGRLRAEKSWQKIPTCYSTRSGRCA